MKPSDNVPRADRMIYTDTAHGRIEVLSDRRDPVPVHAPMRDVLDVPRYLAAQGFRYIGDGTQDTARCARVAARRSAARYLAEHAARLGRFIGTVNALAHQALDAATGDLVHPVQQLKEPLRGGWLQAVRALDQARVLRWSGQERIEFPDGESARFLGGGWLEEYAYAVAWETGLHDVRLGVTGVWEGTERARNEFDVLACHRNRLLCIECKTLRFREHENDNDLAYKVKSLGEAVRGLFGETWVLVAQEPTPVLQERATQAGFRLVGPRLLASVPIWMRLWQEGRSVS